MELKVAEMDTQYVFDDALGTKIALLINHPHIGTSGETGRRQLGAFFAALKEMPHWGGTIILYGDALELLDEAHEAHAPLLAAIGDQFDCVVWAEGKDVLKGRLPEPIKTVTAVSMLMRIDEADRVITL